MSTSDHKLVVTLLAHAAESWAEGDDGRSRVWCERAWAHAAGRKFIDTDEEATR
jgi:hypothetical protein